MSGSPGTRGTADAPTRPCPLCGTRAPAGGGAPGGASKPSPVRCPGCDLVFIDPIPRGALDPAAYGHGYYEPWQGRELRPRLRMWGRRLRQVERRAPAGTLLDVGCGDGLFLRVARDAGWQAEGIEFSPEGARRASERLGRPVAVGDLARGGMHRGPFGVVTLWHVLEHLPDAAAMLEAARRRLAPGGLLAVAVPNLENLPMRVAYRLARRRPLPLFDEGAREPHLTHFSPATLALALRRHGFMRIEVLPDHCALTLPKRLIDAAAGLLSRLSGRLLTDAMVAFGRVPG